MNWGEVGRFVVGSWLWDRFYPATKEEADKREKPSQFERLLLTVRLVTIAVLAVVIYKTFKK